jgi:putative MATE family efflux protein
MPRAAIDDYALLSQPVGAVLVKMTLPMLMGVISFLFMSLTDFYWVSKLGEAPLAAIGFIFPITFILVSLCVGLGVGLSVTIAYAIGAKDEAQAKRLISQGLLLSFLLVSALGVFGCFTLEPLFGFLGVEQAVRSHICEYFSIWSANLGILGLAMAGSASLRGLGDSHTSGMVMVWGAFMCFFLDPLFIFGYGPIPAHGVKGAAMSSVGEWISTSLLSLFFLHFRYRLVSLSALTERGILACWKRILAVALPATGSSALSPLAAATTIGMVAYYGSDAIAGYGVGTRLEALFTVVILALASILVPFVGQNSSAGYPQRVRESVRLSLIFLVAWDFMVLVLIQFFSEPLSHLFSKDPNIDNITRLYLYCIPFNYLGFGGTLLACSFLNGIKEPGYGMLLAFLRVVVLIIPLAYLGGELLGLKGLFMGVSVANLLSGLFSYLLIRSKLKG